MCYNIDTTFKIEVFMHTIYLNCIEFRNNISKMLEKVRFFDTEVVLMLYNRPVAKLTKFSSEQEDVEKQADTHK